MVTLIFTLLESRLDEFALVPFQAFLVHADLLFLTRSLRTLTADCSSPLVRDTVVALTLQSQSFEHLAEAAFVALCDSQCNALDESWRSAGGVADCHVAPRRADVERAGKRILFQLERFDKAVGDAKPPAAVLAARCCLLRHSAQLVVDSVVELGDIGDEESVALYETLLAIVEPLERQAATLGGDNGDDVDSDGANDESNTVKATHKRIAMLRDIVVLLDMKLADISDNAERLAASVGRQRMARMIKALFSSSDKRTRLLKTLE